MQGKMKEVMCEAEVQQAYRVFDKDKNGSIPLSELRQEKCGLFWRSDLSADFILF
jgi:Ca2+-binding EF-hand superfamily protein